MQQQMMGVGVEAGGGALGAHRLPLPLLIQKKYSRKTLKNLKNEIF